MPRRPLIAVAAAVVVVGLAVVSSVRATQSAVDPGGALETAFLPVDVPPAGANAGVAQIRNLGASTVIVNLQWSAVVSPSAGSAGDFDPTDPASPYYNWSTFDAYVRAAAANGLGIIGLIAGTPGWALVAPKPGMEATLPDPQALAHFATAAARRYSGSFAGLPKVEGWKVWNEPNISLFFKPQFVDGQPFSPGWYRTMVNDVYDAVKAVSPDVLVIAGGTAPFFDNSPEVVAIDPDWGPLSFMRQLFCLSDTLRPTCSTPVKFDVWGANPYTEGSPSRRASLPNDVSLPDLPKMRAVLEAAKDAGNILSTQPVRFWATEFSWDSKPPDAGGVPETQLVRWVPEALHQMWASGISTATWFTLKDFAPPSDYQAGLTFGDGTAKAYTWAFTFPLVGTSRRNQLEIWGRTPGGHATDVAVQRSTGGAWITLATLSSDANGIFQARVGSEPTGLIRAVLLSPSCQAAGFPAECLSASYPLGADPEVNKVYGNFGNPPLQPPPTWSRPPIPPLTTGGSGRRISVQQHLP